MRLKGPLEKDIMAHVLARSRGGKHTVNNIVHLCFACDKKFEKQIPRWVKPGKTKIEFKVPKSNFLVYGKKA